MFLKLRLVQSEMRAKLFKIPREQIAISFLKFLYSCKTLFQISTAYMVLIAKINNFRLWKLPTVYLTLAIASKICNFLCIFEYLIL